MIKKDRPLVTYLDTSDYISTFGKPETDKNSRVLKEMLRLRDEGKVTFGYSIITLIEFITKPPEGYSQERKDRGKYVKKICGLQAFPYPPDLEKGACFPNGGRWIGRANDNFVDLQRTVKAIERNLRSRIRNDKSLPRHERRRIAATATLRDFLKATKIPFGHKRGDFPNSLVSDEFIEGRYLERAIMGEIPFGLVEKHFSSWMNDPEKFSEIIYDYSNSENLIDRFFDGFRDLEAKFSDLAAMRVEIQEFNQSTSEINTQVSKLTSDEDSKVATRLKKLAIPKYSARDFDERISKSLGKKHSKHFSHYLEYMWKNPSSFKRSDFFDLWQLCYAYEADLIRCDKRMAHIFSDFAPFEGKLVPKFSELPQRILDLRR
ncbi:hypothetical protein [Mameliella sp.]|uniref:hypothetical protein n=1 Tax=Mameliella sp. TaxID=1924940 RepID=UPI003BA9B882